MDWYGTIIEWDVKGGSIDGKVESNRNILRAALLPDGKRAVTTGLTVDFWDMQKGTQIAQGDLDLEAHGLAISAAGDVVTGDTSGDLVLWDPQTGRRLREIKIPGGVGNVRFIDTDEVSLCTTPDTLWNFKTGQTKTADRGFTVGTLSNGTIGVLQGGVVVNASDGRNLMAALPDGGRGILSADPRGARLLAGAIDPKGRWVAYAVTAGSQPGGDYVSSGPGVIFVYDVKKLTAAAQAATTLADYAHEHQLNSTGDPQPR